MLTNPIYSDKDKGIFFFVFLENIVFTTLSKGVSGTIYL